MIDSLTIFRYGKPKSDAGTVAPRTRLHADALGRRIEGRTAGR